MTEIILQTELEKHIKPLTDEQRFLLLERLMGLRESRDKIQHRAESVLLQDTYGTIAFSYWVKDLICLRSTAAWDDFTIENERIRAKIRRMLENFKRQLSEPAKKQDKELAELDGLNDAVREWRMELEEIRDREKQKGICRIQAACRKLIEMDNPTRRRVLYAAVHCGIIEEYDNAIIANCHIFADKLYVIVENMRD